MMWVKLGTEYLATHRPRWAALPGPFILAYVEDPDDRNSKIYWQDLKSDDSYSKANKAVVLVPKFQTFGSEAKGALRRLAGSVPDSVPLQTIDLRTAQSLLATHAFDRMLARTFYRQWSESIRREQPQIRLKASKTLGCSQLHRPSR